MMRRSVALLALVWAAAAACDYPTEAPRWDQTWQVAGERVSISVAELLPADVTLDETGTAFVAQVPGTSLTFSLADMCPECALLDGTTAPKPEFEETLTTSTTLPADLVSATLIGGSFPVTMSHDFNFDPLVPSEDPEAERGFIGITISSDGNIVADTTLSGDDHTFPTGGTLAPTLNIRSVAVTSDLQIEVRIYSPAGDDATIESSDTMGVAVATSTFHISEATVAAGPITVDPVTTSMDFAGIEDDSPILDRIQSGALLFEVTNPFTITGSLDLAFQIPGQSIERTLAIEEGDYSARMEFTGEELRAILGSDEVDLVASGGLTPTEGSITLTPTQEMVLENRFELVLMLGGSEEEEG